MDADDQPEINFSIPQGQLTWQSNYVGFSAWAPWTQAASGSAGRANVGFCSASTLCHCVPIKTSTFYYFLNISVKNLPIFTMFGAHMWLTV